MRKVIWSAAAVVLVSIMLFPLVAPAWESTSVDLFVGGRGGYPTYRIPAMVVTPKGTILAFCEGRKTGILDHGDLDLVLKRSFDGGRTWGPLQTIEKKGFQTWGNPAPVVDRDTGRVWLPFCLNNDRVFVTWSDDEGETWAKPREITADVKEEGWTWYATGPGHAVQLSSGRLLVPCDHASMKGVYSHVIYSDDHGETWRLGGVLDKGTDECMALETADGRVYLTMRNVYGKRRRAYAWSEDGGLTWSPVMIEESLTCPTCQASVVRLGPEKDFAVFLNPAHRKRRNMAFRISRDGAKSWSEPHTIHAGRAAYSDLAVLPGGGVAALYENGAIWPYSKITFTVIDPGWIEQED